MGIVSNAIELAARITDANYRREANIRDGLQKASTLVRAQAQANAPFRSGNLRSSLANRVEDTTAVVYSDVTYAPFQEEGTKYIKGRRFMKRALTSTRDEISTILGKAVKDAL